VVGNAQGQCFSAQRGCDRSGNCGEGWLP
jgi:hypothetical protein